MQEKFTETVYFINVTILDGFFQEKSFEKDFVSKIYKELQVIYQRLWTFLSVWIIFLKSYSEVHSIGFSTGTVWSLNLVWVMPTVQWWLAFYRSETYF